MILFLVTRHTYDPSENHNYHNTDELGILEAESKADALTKAMTYCGENSIKLLTHKGDLDRLYPYITISLIKRIDQKPA